MIGTYKQFWNFIRVFNPSFCDLWEDINNRPNPNKGDKFRYIIGEDDPIIIFDKVEYDPTFDNGVAFIYKFHREDNNEKIDVYSINDVEDIDKFHKSDRSILNLYRFWKVCKPL